MVETVRKRSLRRSFLMAPADRGDLLKKQATSPADVAVICIEDAVLPERKEAARAIAASVIRSSDYSGKELFIRINSLDSTEWLNDLEYFCEHAPPDGFTLTKVKTPEDIKVLARVLQTLERRFNIPAGSILISCYIETAEAMRHVYDIAAAHERLANMHFGAEDYTHSIDAVRTPQQFETLYAMSRIVSAARAAGVEPINVMHTQVHDEDGLRRTSKFSRELGFTGRSCPTPKHVPVIHDVFAPGAEQIEHSRKVLKGYQDARGDGSGVYMVDGMMIDAPMISRAMRVLDRASVQY